MGASGATRTGKENLRDLLTGACLAGICAALVWQFYPGFWKTPPGAVYEIALQRRQALEQAQQEAADATQAAVQPVAVPAPCELEPLIPPGNAQDGQATLEHPFPGGARAKAKAFLRKAEAAATRGRLRDAEVALLAACREYDAASAKPTVPLAHVLGLLGERYAAAAGAENASMLREQLLARAQHVLSLSAQAYAGALGPNASRSRQARQRVATLEQDLAGAADVPQPGSDRLHDDAPAGEAGAMERSEAPEVASPRSGRMASLPVRQRSLRDDPVTQQPAPEPERERAGVESQPELRQLASDLARLQAQAGAVSDDPAGFRRRAEVARAERERCPDAHCLRDWYAKRRQELLAEF